MINLIWSLLEIDTNHTLAGTIAIGMMVAIIIFCATWLILKRLNLKKKFKADEDFVKEYKKRLDEREAQEKLKAQKSENIGEDF